MIRCPDAVTVRHSTVSFKRAGIVGFCVESPAWLPSSVFKRMGFVPTWGSSTSRETSTHRTVVLGIAKSLDARRGQDFVTVVRGQLVQTLVVADKPADGMPAIR